MSKAMLELRNERNLRDSLDQVGLVSTGPQVVSVFAVLAGALGIALVAARVLPESLQSNLTSRPILSGLIGVVALLSIASALPLGRSLTRRLSIPYIGVGQDLGKFTFLAAELGVLVLVFRLFDLETSAFYEDIAVLAFAGFLVHHFLPSAYRQPFFLALSLVGILSVVGPINAAWIVGIGLLLVGITRLPLAFNLRVVLLLAVGAVLALFRANLVPAPFSLVVFPIVGSIFMFRLVIYLYDLKHSKTAPGLTQTLSYFFLLPNVIFPLFPPVDFTAFRRTYFDSDQYEIYQRGIRMLVRGTTYLLLYRFLYYYVVIAPSDVNNAGDLLRYLTSNYMLILRIIGDYDLIVGMLHLFGFNLGDANLLNFFATSFTDFWRRANIYWKDLMLKVVYYPSYFRLRKLGPTAGLALATAIVFVLTWLLHSYQWFWILGAFPVTPQDALFWGSFGLLMVGNLLWEQRFGRKRALKGSQRSWRELAGKGIAILGMFAAICVLWSLWTSQSLAEWLSLWEAAPVLPAFDLEAILVALAGAIMFVVIYGAVAVEWNLGSPKKSFFRGALATGAIIVLIYLISSPFTYTRLGAQAQGFITDLQLDRLNQPDANNLTRGYYENLLAVNGANSQLWQLYMQKEPKDVWIQQTSAVRYTGDFMDMELRPNSSIIFRGKPFHVNSWGMRDRDYTLAKPANTYRIALLGPSYVMGSGVGDNETFENLLEDRMNSEDAGKPFGKYQILNFAISSYTDAQQVEELEDKALQFRPDAVFLVQTSIDPEVMVRLVAQKLFDHVEIPFPELDEFAAKAGADKAPSVEDATRRLMPYKFDLVAWSYNRIVQDAKSRGIVPVWIYLPDLGHPEDAQRLADLTRLARQAGFTTIDLSDVYRNQDTASLQVASWDAHPNARGHQLIAEKLYAALHEPTLWTALRLDNPSSASVEPTPVLAQP